MEWCGCFLCMLDNPCTCRPIQYAPCAERHGWTFTWLGRINGGNGGAFVTSIVNRLWRIEVLGVNISIMAVPGAIMGILGRHWMKQVSVKKRPWIGSLIGGVTILISAILLYVTLSTTHTALMPLAKLVFLGHIPIAIVEGIISFWLVHFLQKVKPSLLGVTL